MEINKNYIRKIALQLIEELYARAEQEPKIMVINWLGYAYKLICNESSPFMKYECGDIDDYMSTERNTFTEEVITLIGEDNLKLKQLSTWHDYHWLRSQMEQYQSEYDKYLHLTELRLPNYLLYL